MASLLNSYYKSKCAARADGRVKREGIWRSKTIVVVGLLAAITVQTVAWCAETYDPMSALSSEIEALSLSLPAQADSCPADPIPSGGTCPADCTYCLGGNQCVITCDATAGCASSPVICPDGFNCQVECLGTGACNNTQVSCPGDNACNVICDGTRACANLTVSCSGNASCRLLCDGAVDSCNGTELECANGACESTCSGGQTPTVFCNASCNCNDGCSRVFDDGFEAADGGKLLTEDS